MLKAKFLLDDTMSVLKYIRSANLRLGINARCVSNLSHKESFLNGSSSTYLEEMYNAWLEDPNSVHKSWNSFFGAASQDASPGSAYQPPPSLSVHGMPAHAMPAPAMSSLPAVQTGTVAPSSKDIADHLAVQTIIRAYQVRGHHIADLDPLGIAAADLEEAVPSDLLHSNYDLSEADMSREFRLPIFTHIGGENNSMKLKDIIKRLQDVYCSSIGVEFMFINNLEQCDWIKKQFEHPEAMKLTTD